MPAFTAIGAYVAVSLMGLAAGSVAAVVVGGIVAVGAAMLTSRLINGSPDTGGADAAAQAAQGTRVQLSPSTENKIPVLYGTAYCNGIVTDAYLDNDQQTMTYVMVISETCNVSGATYTVDDVYWNDERLVFSNTDGSRVIEGRKNVNNPDGVTEDSIDTHYDGKVFINIYAGNSQTRPLGKFGKSQAAYDIEYLRDHWDNTYQYPGLVFAVVQINYNSENGFTGLPTMTFKITNSVSNPAAVLQDYMTSDRYGANIDITEINQNSISQYESWSNELVTYTSLEGTTTTHKRYRINGLIDTSRNCQDNINSILLNSAAWMSYDVALGQWRVIPKKELPGTTWTGPGKTGTAIDPPADLVFDDDNIVSGIQLTSTNLDNLFNQADIDYYDKYNRDQRGYVRVSLPEQDRNYNEPNNSLKLTLDLVNDNVQAERLANVELKQSRDDLMVNFIASHQGIQAQAGDVIAVVQSLYGWTAPSYPLGKYFRILKTVERELEDGSLVNDITALEYNADVYADENIQEFTTLSNIGIVPRSSSTNLPSPEVRIGNVNSSGGTPSFSIEVTIPDTGGPFDELQIWYAEGDDYAGLGGDVVFTGQIAGTTLDVITVQSGVINALVNSGVGTTVTGQGVTANTLVTQFGAVNANIFGNGKTGQYTVTPASTNTGIRAMTGTVNDAKFTGFISGRILTVTSVEQGTIQLQSLIVNGVILGDTVITGFISASGGVGTYSVNKAQTSGSSQSPIGIISKKPYPSAAVYQYYKSVLPNPNNNGLFNFNEIREELITALPANSLNKKYFIKCRLGIDKEYGPFSDLGEVDLEAPVVYWNPDGMTSLNIKQELVKMDFGHFTIPRNGLWLMRTSMQLDAGSMAAINRDTFNLDLGNFEPEREIGSAELIQDFTFDPNA